MAVHFKGPIFGSSETAGGALEGAPIELISRSEWVTYFNDFNNIDKDYLTTTDFSLTQVSGGGSAAVQPFAGGYTGFLRLDCPADEDGPIVQFDSSAAAGTGCLAYSPFDESAGSYYASEAVFMSRFRINDITGCGTFVGLAELNASSAIKATPQGAITSDTHIGFAHRDSDNGAVYFTVAGNDDTAATTASAVTVASFGWVEVALKLKGTKTYHAYVKESGANKKWNLVASGQLSTGWDAAMLISFVNIGGGAGDDLDVDYVGLAVKRDTTV